MCEDGEDEGRKMQEGRTTREDTGRHRKCRKDDTGSAGRKMTEDEGRTILEMQDGR